MTKIDIFSGFLGAGKTTLIKKLIKEAYAGERVVLIENEFGEIGIDGGFLQDAGIEITEMNSGCICCSLVGDFTEALGKVLAEYTPDRIIIEPSGVGKLSDVIRAVSKVTGESASLNCFTTIVDAGKCKMYMKNFGEFFNDQIENASAIILSHTDTAKEHKVLEAVELIKEHNSKAVIISTPIAELDGKDILAAMERKDTLEDAMKELREEHEHHHHHHHEHDDEHCCCGHHHDHDEDEHEHHHHEHDDEHCCCGHHHGEDEHEHHHHHEHGEHCSCGGHHHHHADEVFTSFGVETPKKFTLEGIKAILDSFDEDSTYGLVLRAKGIVAGEDGSWIHFDYVPGEPDVRVGSAGVIGRLCVIGSDLNNDKIRELFGV
jgi:G3E family GTPase